MEKLKLLITTGDFRRYLHKSFYYLLEEISKQAEIYEYNHSGNIHNILNKLNIEPDFIFINEFNETNSPNITGLSSLTIPFGVYLHDLHYQVEKRRSLLNQVKPDYIFAYYRDQFYRYFPEFIDRFIWLPHHVNTQVFKDYKEEKTIESLLMGSVHKYIYPLRFHILNQMKNISGFVYHHHPGYRDYSDHEKVFIDHRYAKELNRAKIFFTCDSKYKYPVNKYFEALACKTLLLAPASPELEDLGFIPDKHFVAISKENFLNKTIHYLNNQTARKQIVENGYRMVCEKHSTVTRAKQLVETINKILSEKRERY